MPPASPSARPPRRPGRPSRQSANPETRSAILRTSLDLFAARGYDAVTTAEIARRAGVTPPLLHYYFASKEKLWKETISTGVEPMQRAFLETRDRLKDQPGDVRLRELIREFVRFSAHHPQLPRIVLQEGSEATDRLDWLVGACLKPLHDLFEAAAREAEAAGYVPRFPAPNLMFAIIGASTLFFAVAPVVTRLYDIDPFSPEEVERQASTVVDTLFGQDNAPGA